MVADAHLDELNEKHRNLEHAIAHEMAKPYGDDLKVQELKREKLKLKDLIERMQHSKMN